MMHVKARGKVKIQHTIQIPLPAGINFEDDITNSELSPRPHLQYKSLLYTEV